jgi:hypothetical protein
MTGPDSEQPCKECMMGQISWGQVATIALGVVGGLLLAGLAARVAR